MTGEVERAGQVDPVVYANVSAVLRDVVGLGSPDLSDPLHAQLFEAVVSAGVNASLGQRIVALRFVFNWELREAGRQFAEAKAAYEHAVSRRVVEEQAKAAQAGVRQSLGLAEAIAETDAYEQKLQYLLAEQRERAMRKFLETLDAALENHRTDRADMRAGDRAHAQGYSGGA